MADGSYAPLATSSGDAENPTTTAVGRADRRPLLGGDGAVPAPAETSALASGADPHPTPSGGSDPEWAAAGGTVEAWLAGVHENHRHNCAMCALPSAPTNPVFKRPAAHSVSTLLLPDECATNRRTAVTTPTTTSAHF